MKHESTLSVVAKPIATQGEINELRPVTKECRDHCARGERRWKVIGSLSAAVAFGAAALAIDAGKLEKGTGWTLFPAAGLAVLSWACVRERHATRLKFEDTLRDMDEQQYALASLRAKRADPIEVPVVLNGLRPQ